jgi:hypothetical protein
VFEPRLSNAHVCASFIRMQRRTEFNVLMDNALNCLLSVLLIVMARVRPPRSRIPRTAVLPTVPRPALSFLDSCLFF